MTVSTIRKTTFRLAMGLLLAAMATASASAGDGSIRHRFLMRGQVLELDAGSVIVCVGAQDGAAVGQVLDVVRHVRQPTRGKQVAPQYRRQEIGSVKITSLFGEHYAVAQVVKGAPKVNDTVELEQQP